ncbi:hypothetical protein [Burkholderia sp. Bp8984]|uniref:hypothetical protein n=1 Tax=Burkholderia sp. Bp8984 TaxID=2184549 RepID=UPI000F598AF0|nr:hypothetical protein [Burkholderia sp. Bp8984]RQS63845.1 hypothetical protein DID98_02890 [Burkholderia sp. Bp8984]
MAVTVVDGNNVEAILADAGVVTEKPEPKDDPKPVDKSAEKLEQDDEEDENGLTAAQKAEFTEKMQKAIGKKHRMQKEAEEFAAEQYNTRRLAEERAARLEAELAELRSKSAPAKEEKAPEKPVRANFESEEEYVDAMIQYGVDQRLREKAAEDAKARAEREREERMAAIKGRIDHAIEIVPDFAAVMDGNDAVIPPAIAGYMEKSEMIAELAYHFAKNPDVLVSLAKLPADVQLVKIGKLESTLSPFGGNQPQNDSKSSTETNGQAKPAPSADTDIVPSKPRGKAAPVITPLEGTGSAGVAKDSKDMNIRETIDDWSKRNKVNLGMRKRH